MRTYTYFFIGLLSFSAAHAENNCDEATKNNDLIECAVRNLKAEKLAFSIALKQLGKNHMIRVNDRTLLKRHYISMARESEYICNRIHVEGRLSSMYSNACAAAQFRALTTMAKGMACENRQDSDYCQE